MVRRPMICGQLSSLIVVLCWAFMVAGDARHCLAADPPLPQAPAARVPVEIEGQTRAKPAADPSLKQVRVTPAATKVQRERAQALFVFQAAAVKAVPAKPAAKKGTLADAIINVFGGGQALVNRPVAGRPVANQDQQLRAMEAQYRPQFQQMLYMELAILRRACKPDAKTFLNVARTSKADLHAPLREYAAALNTPRMRSAADDPRAAVQKMLAPLAEAKLGAEKGRLYRQECDKRLQARKHATIMNLVAALDGRLVLTSRQRGKLVESLTAKYDYSWEQYLEIYGGFNQFFPMVPESSIVPVLDEKQKSVWQETAKMNGQIFFGGMFFRGAQFGEAEEIQEIARMVEDVKDGP